MAHDSYPKRAGGLGKLGEGVSIDFVAEHGSRAQKRRLARHLARQKAAESIAARRAKK